MQSFVKAKENGEHLSAMVSSLRMQLDESNAEKRHLHYENKSLRARLDENERNDRARVSHRTSVLEKDAAARESTHVVTKPELCTELQYRRRASGHGIEGTENPSQLSYTTLPMRSENGQQRDHTIGPAGSDRTVGERNLVAAQVCHTPLSLHH